MFRKVLREFFLLRPGEQRALILVSVILLLSVVIRTWVHLSPPGKVPGMEQFRAEALRMSQELARLDSVKRGEEGEAAGGSVSGSAYVASIPQPTNKRNSFTPKQQKLIIDLNSADSASLLPLPGIGPVYAGRIIKYRELLGGYVRVDQLLEVYGMDSMRYKPLLPLVECNGNNLRRLDLNRADFRELLRHPYLEYEDVLAFVRYRDEVGRLGSPGELMENSVLRDSIFLMLQAYLFCSE